MPTRTLLRTECPKKRPFSYMHFPAKKTFILYTCTTDGKKKVGYLPWIGFFFFSRSDSFVVAATSRAVDVRPGAPTEDGESCSVCYARPRTVRCLPCSHAMSCELCTLRSIKSTHAHAACPALPGVPCRRGAPRLPERAAVERPPAHRADDDLLRRTGSTYRHRL